MSGNFVEKIESEICSYLWLSLYLPLTPKTSPVPAGQLNSLFLPCIYKENLAPFFSAPHSYWKAPKRYI